MNCPESLQQTLKKLLFINENKPIMTDLVFFLSSTCPSLLQGLPVSRIAREQYLTVQTMWQVLRSYIPTLPCFPSRLGVRTLPSNMLYILSSHLFLSVRSLQLLLLVLHALSGTSTSHDGPKLTQTFFAQLVFDCCNPPELPVCPICDALEVPCVMWLR